MVKKKKVIVHFGRGKGVVCGSSSFSKLTFIKSHVSCSNCKRAMNKVVVRKKRVYKRAKLRCHHKGCGLFTLVLSESKDDYWLCPHHRKMAELNKSLSIKKIIIKEVGGIKHGKV